MIDYRNIIRNRELLLQILRLWPRAVCDGSGYYQAFVSVSHMALGIWILCVFFLLGRYLPKQMLRLSHSRMVTKLDGISLYVYMTHNVFIVSDLSPYRHTDNLLLSTALFFLLAFVSAMVLRWTAGRVRLLFAAPTQDMRK